MNAGNVFSAQLPRIQRAALVVGLAGAALLLGGAAAQARQFLQSYLHGYLFWLSLSLGCLAILMLHHVVGGAWGFPVRRLLEAGSGTIVLMAVLFLPFVAGLGELYSWARPQEVAADALLQHKRPYLNVPFFVGRAVCYFAVWAGAAWLLTRWSEAQDRTADPTLVRRFQLLSAPGLVLYGLTVSFAAVDWVMSLEPHWFSTIYGMLFMIGQALEALAFVIVVASLLASRGALGAAASPANFHDLGNLLLTCVMLWAYLSFSQFLIIWAANLKEEIPWYLHRTAGGWQWIAISLIVVQFALPFLFLLSRAAKRSPQALAAVAGLILGMRMIELFWLVAPAFHPAALRLHWMDLVAPVGVGGLWIFVFARHLKGRPLLPLNDPRMPIPAGRAGEA